jgi:hypothetical protein
VRRRILAAAALTVTAGCIFASAAMPARAALTTCHTVTAGGKAWHVQVAGAKCGSAQAIVRRVAVAKPDHVVRRSGGELDQYLATFSGLRCFKSVAKVGSEIQCSSSDGKKLVLGIYKP